VDKTNGMDARVLMASRISRDRMPVMECRVACCIPTHATWRESPCNGFQNPLDCYIFVVDLLPGGSFLLFTDIQGGLAGCIHSLSFQQLMLGF
jgi:hypothetical protein